MQVRLMRASRVHADRPQGRVPRAVRQWGRALRHIAQPDSEAPSSTLSGTDLLLYTTELVHGPQLEVGQRGELGLVGALRHQL